MHSCSINFRDVVVAIEFVEECLGLGDLDLVAHQALVDGLQADVAACCTGEGAECVN
jgi:hypothetical protein